jgi:hypothetical protein
MTTPNQTTPLTPPYKLEIECPETSYYTVRIGDRWQDKLTWDDMLRLVAALTIPSPRACL